MTLNWILRLKSKSQHRLCGLFQSVCLLNVPLDLCLEFEEWDKLLSFIRPVASLKLLMTQAKRRVKHVYLKCLEGHKRLFSPLSELVFVLLKYFCHHDYATVNTPTICFNIYIMCILSMRCINVFYALLITNTLFG
jgi:hypothetical protein